MIRSIVYTLLLLLNIELVLAQGSGFGYNCDIGSKNNFDVGDGYDQSLKSVRHNFFIRFHSDNYKKASQFQIGFRTDSLWFQNYSNFLSEDGMSIDNFSTDAYLIRKTISFGLLKQFQFTKNPRRFVFALNYGFAYEFVNSAKRYSMYDNISYNLEDELYKSNLVLIGGAEVRYLIFTMGFKLERNLFGVINHENINDQLPSQTTSSELRGVRWDPTLAYFYFGFKFDI